jgi:hypothetical protein
MSVANVSSDGFLFLTQSSSAFKENNIPKANICFEASGELKNHVFEQLWINRGKPMGNPQFGEFSFRDQYGYFSTNLDKAKAIDDFVSFAYISEAKDNENLCMMYNHFQEGFSREQEMIDANDRIERTFKLHKFADKMSPLPAHCEIPVKYALIGAAGCSFAVLVADAVRKAMGYS